MPAKLTVKSCLVVLVALVCVGGLLRLTSRAGDTVRVVSQTLPSGWIIRAPIGTVVQTDTMPQGAALSSDGSVLAVVESGFNPPTLRLYDAKTLRETRSIALKGAFGRPLWRGDHVLVAGANTDAILEVDTHTGVVRTIALPAKSYPVALAAKGDLIAAATDGDGSVRIGSLENVATAQPVHIGEHPGGLAFSSDGTKLFAAVRSGDYVTSIDVAHKTTHRIAAGLHPSDVLTAGNELYVAESDADSVGVYDTNDDHRIADIYVGNGSQADRVFGASPNALASQGGDVFVSLGAANEIAVLREHRLVERLPAGWYPTDVVPAAGRLFVIDGKGEGTRPNVHFDVFSKGYHDYIAAIQYGSIRTVPLSSAAIADENPQGTAGWSTAAGNGIVRKGGPIKHVFFILKENRSYDQVLGDMPQGNGDKALNWFGRTVTPNQHALAGRFGLFDNAYANGEVSSAGHNWADAAIANDYVERYWPPSYGGRRDTDDLVVGYGAEVPANGLIWDDARAARVSFRDYGEIAPTPGATAPTLGNRFDPHYVGWNLDYSDLDRYKEWHREFDAFVRAGTVPQFEYLWLPNDHTYGSRAGKSTPAAYIATNDYAVGLIVQAISHSSIWKSSAIFITEDDAQDGADHVSDQRTTLYIASPYARGGLQHAHYSTVAVLRTIELILGMKPLTTYDAKAVPLYAAFGPTAHMAPFNVIRPLIDLKARNSKVAYGTQLSARADFSRPDAVAPKLLLNILSRNHEIRPAHT